MHTPSVLFHKFVCSKNTKIMTVMMMMMMTVIMMYNNKVNYGCFVSCIVLVHSDTL